MMASDRNGPESVPSATKGVIGPIIIQDLNEQFLSSGVFTIAETVVLDENGAAVLIRRSEPCRLEAPAAMFQSRLDGLRARFPEVQTFHFGFDAGHRFMPSHLMKHEAKTLDGKALPSTEVPVFGSTEIRVKLPMAVRVEDQSAIIDLPGYTLEVHFAQLARRLGGTWFLQWSQGNLARGKFRLELTVPNLRRSLWKRCFYNQFFSVTPDYQAATATRPLRSWLNDLFRRLRDRQTRRPLQDRSSNQTNHDREEERGAAVVWPKLAGKTFTYRWEHVLRTPETFSIHVNYGVRYRKRLFSPLGLLASTAIAVILTVLLTEPLTDFFRFLGRLFGH